jgi:DNA-binding transcriptional regulator YiaG
MTRSESQARTYQSWKARQLKDSAFRQAFESGLDWLRLGASVAILRGQMKLSQAKLASLAHTSQPVISRLEGGQNVQLETVHRVAQALGAKVKIELISPKQGVKARSRKPHFVKRNRVSSAV